MRTRQQESKKLEQKVEIWLCDGRGRQVKTGRRFVGATTTRVTRPAGRREGLVGQPNLVQNGRQPHGRRQITAGRMHVNSRPASKRQARGDQCQKTKTRRNNTNPIVKSMAENNVHQTDLQISHRKKWKCVGAVETWNASTHTPPTATKNQQKKRKLNDNNTKPRREDANNTEIRRQNEKPRNGTQGNKGMAVRRPDGLDGFIW